MSCHVGGISKSDIGKESDNDSNGSNGEDDGEETSDSSGSNHKAHSPLEEDRESQDHSSGPDFEGSIHSEDGEEWYQKESEEGDDNESFEDKDSNEWLGVVKWISSNYEFAAGGDSGSLVFATEGNIIIPIGIHVGRPRSGFSIFISLETYCFKAESHGHTLEFAKR